MLLRFPWSMTLGSWSNHVGKSCFQGNLLTEKDEKGFMGCERLQAQEGLRWGIAASLVERVLVGHAVAAPFVPCPHFTDEDSEAQRGAEAWP